MSEKRLIIDVYQARNGWILRLEGDQPIAMEFGRRVFQNYDDLVDEVNRLLDQVFKEAE